ncbi:sugar ABC transporter substrate-binding protein [Nocardioides caldifontis]|uniref:sugar ABC transporter substrate-binding protein n=1 Tax=Nocardioides caldifontis TaxID=2588938 RepID=UPI0011DF9B17|nr:substrate-binding domain-containing protein [Nocardioides caldifontis]
MTRRRINRAVALGATTLLTLTVAACGDDDGGSSSNGGGGGGGGESTGSVGVILPDSVSSPRWEANDRPSLQAAFDEAGIESNIQNAEGDVAKFGTICDSMINEGVDVLMIVNLDSESGRACLQKATDAGIVSIDYDRLTLGGGAQYYVSFDNVEVGRLMGQGLQQCLDDAGKTKANIAYINGDPTDNNAALFKEGYVEALTPKIDTGDYKLVGDQTGEWDADKAADAFDGIYTSNDGKVDGVVSANDTMAGGIVARLKANGLAGKVPVTGQDASVEGLQRVLAGTQCMTVYKNTALEAKAASDLAIALINQDEAAADELATGSVPDTETGEDVKSVLATPEAIFKDDVKKVIDDGFQSAEDVCTGEFAKFCEEAGIQ